MNLGLAGGSKGMIGHYGVWIGWFSFEGRGLVRALFCF